MKLRLLLSIALLVLLLVGLSLASAPARCVLCLPLPPAPGPQYAPRAFLPLILAPGSPPAPGVCEVVEQEPNDVHTQAQALDRCVSGAAYNDLDMDWYRLEACQGPVNLTLRLTAAENLDLYLYGDPPGYPLAVSESWGGDEEIRISELLTGTYYALVQPALGAQGTYVLEVEASWAQ